MYTTPIVVTEAMHLWPYKQEVPSSSLGAPTTQPADSSFHQQLDTSCLTPVCGARARQKCDLSVFVTFLGPCARVLPGGLL